MGETMCLVVVDLKQAALCCVSMFLVIIQCKLVAFGVRMVGWMFIMIPQQHTVYAAVSAWFFCGCTLLFLFFQMSFFTAATSRYISIYKLIMQFFLCFPCALSINFVHMA